LKFLREVEEVIQREREENLAAYFKSMLSLVQKDVSVEGQIGQEPLKTQFLPARAAWIERILRAKRTHRKLLTLLRTTLRQPDDMQ